jgi:hypothetical protein
MAQVRILASSGDDRYVTITVSDTLLPASGPLPARRRVSTANVKGVDGAQSRFRIKMLVSGWQTLWKGAAYPFGPPDLPCFIIDDANSEYSGDLIHGDGTPVEWEFVPTLPDGTPE